MLSFKLTKENKSNPYCGIFVFPDNFEFKNELIQSYETKISCNTFIIQLVSKEELNSKQVESILSQIQSDLKEYTFFIQVQFKNEQTKSILFGTIDLKNEIISYVK